jgi:hypothetical protein
MIFIETSRTQLCGHKSILVRRPADRESRVAGFAGRAPARPL